MLEARDGHFTVHLHGLLNGLTDKALPSSSSTSSRPFSFSLDRDVSLRKMGINKFLPELPLEDYLIGK